jgi:hypothetical protein
MNRKTLQLTLIVILIMTMANSIKAQVFTGFTAFKKLIEYEGQRYLMESIYQIKSEDFDKLKIDKTIKEIDANEGFMFVLTSYTFNGKSGVVITSFNSTSFLNTQHQFTNVHLTNDQYMDLYNTFKELEKTNPQYDEHILRKYNDRLIVDVNNKAGIIYFTLWVDYHNRHTFTTAKWDRAFKRYKKFIE